MTASVSDVIPLELADSKTTEEQDPILPPMVQVDTGVGTEANQDADRTDSEPERSRVRPQNLMKRRPLKRSRLDLLGVEQVAVSEVTLSSELSFGKGKVNTYGTHCDTDETDSEPEFRQKRFSPKPQSSVGGPIFQRQLPSRPLLGGGPVSVYAADSNRSIEILQYGKDSKGCNDSAISEPGVLVHDAERTDSEPEPEERLKSRTNNALTPNFDGRVEEIEFLDEDENEDEDRTDSDPEINQKDGEKTDSDSDLEINRQPQVVFLRNFVSQPARMETKLQQPEDEDTDSDLDLRSAPEPARTGWQMSHNQHDTVAANFHTHGPALSAFFSDDAPTCFSAFDTTNINISTEQSLEDDEATETDSEAEPIKPPNKGTIDHNSSAQSFLF